MKIVVDKDKCTGTGKCVEACPMDAIRLVDGIAVIAHEICDLDGICIPVCPTGAIDFSE